MNLEKKTRPIEKDTRPWTFSGAPTTRGDVAPMLRPNPRDQDYDELTAHSLDLADDADRRHDEDSNSDADP